MDAHNVIYKELNKYIESENLLDKLKEAAFTIDKEMVDDDKNYLVLFANMYELFEKKKLKDSYFQIMSQYISNCIFKCEVIDPEVLFDNVLSLRNNHLLQAKITKHELNKIKGLYKQQKQKVLKIN